MQEEDEQFLDEKSNQIPKNSISTSQNLNTSANPFDHAKDTDQTDKNIIDWKSKYLVLKNALQIYINTGNFDVLYQQSEIDFKKKFLKINNQLKMQKNVDKNLHYPLGLEKQLQNEREVICTAKMDGARIMIQKQEKLLNSKTSRQKDEDNLIKNREEIQRPFQNIRKNNNNQHFSCNKNQSLANHPYKVHSFASISRASSSLAAHNQWKPPNLISANVISNKINPIQFCSNQNFINNNYTSQNLSLSSNYAKEQYIQQQACCIGFPINTFNSQNSSCSSFQIGGCNILQSNQKVDKFQIINPQSANKNQNMEFLNNYFINENSIKIQNNMSGNKNQDSQMSQQNMNSKQKKKLQFYKNPQSVLIENDIDQQSEYGSNDQQNNIREIQDNIRMQGFQRCETSTKINHSRLINNHTLDPKKIQYQF